MDSVTKSGKGCGGERLNKREEIYSGKELAGNDSLKGREGLGRIGWGEVVSEGDRRMGQGKVSMLSPQQAASLCP